MASTTDVRAWAREQGREVGTRGALPQELIDDYERAHNAVPGEVLERGDHPYPDDPVMGVTAADFPPDEEESPETPAHRQRAERRPRQVKPGKRTGWRERLAGGRLSGGKPKARHARQNLSDFAEETWADLAWLASPVPPLANILTIQAPYAGVVFDDAVKGTPIDGICQAAARYAGGLRALNGLAGPPVYVGMICATGQRVQLHDPETGKPMVDENGNPVTDFDGRTKMMFAGLRYSLLQMTKIADVRAEEIRERTTSMAERNRAVDAMIESIFGFIPDVPAAPDVPPPGPGPRHAGRADGDGLFTYPDAPVMDGTGADPGRL